MRFITLRGQPFYIHDDEALSNAIARTGDYWEADILDYLKINFPTHSIILDIGANIGNHLSYFARYLTYEMIYGFEPDPTNFDVLRHNTQIINENDNIQIYNIAISNVEPCTEIHLALNHSNWGAHEIQNQGITVEAYPLDHYAYWERVTLIKVDVEWHEPQVLES